jgi:hypothetical protein
MSTLQQRAYIVSVALLMLVSGHAGTPPTFTLDAHVIAAGSSVHAASSCFRLNAVIAEPVAGYSSSTDYAMNAGFLAAVPPTSDEIFFSGFEDCTP